MRICFLATTQSVHTRRWISWFAEHGHDVHVITFESSLPSWLKPQNLQSDLSWRHEGVTIHHLKTLPSIPHSHLISWPVDSIRVKSLLNKIVPDVIHGHVAFPYGFYAVSSGFHPCVVTVWGSDVLIAPSQSKIAKWEVQFTLKRVDLLTCDGQHVVNRLAELGAVKKKTALVCFGTNTQQYKPEQRSEQLRRQLGISKSPAIISVRRLKSLYDVESLIRAAKIVLSQYPEAKFLIAGDGDQRSYLENLAATLGISNSISFLGDLSQDMLPQYLASSDIYVSTSLSDAGLAASTAEAMSSGLPVIITDFGDNKKWVQDKVNGFLVPLQSPQILAEKIILLLRDREAMARFGKANRALILENNNWDKEMGKMEDLYKSLISR